MSAVTEMSFNASVYMSEQLNRQLINMSQDLAYRCVGALAERYNFDAEEACRLLGLAMIRVERKAPIKEKGTKAPKPKTAFPLPYNGEFNDACCFALRQNNGLYTQCTGVRRNGGGQFCKSCATTMQKTCAEVPEYGTIQQRQAVGIFEYVDPKGRKPIAYTKVMKKYKITEEQVLAEADKLNIIINKDHFVVPEDTKRGRPKTEKAPKEKAAKGRPKKSKKVLEIEGDDEDLFATLVAEANEDSEENAGTLAPKSTTTAPKSTTTDGKKKAGKSDEEKEAERLAKEAEKEAKRQAAELAKAEKEAKLAAEKAEKEAKKEAERLAREAKKKAEEEEKEKKRLAAEQAKKEKEAKLAAEKAAKEATKSKPSKKAAAPKASPDDSEPVEDEEPDVVKKIEFEGKKYLKSKKTGIVYDYNEYVKNGEQVVVGKWNDSTNKIEFSADEEEEEEYDI